jgi:RNA polymerase sigma-70 factor (ECF subfamily)
MRPEKQSERIPNATRRDYSREKAVIELAQKGDAKAFEQLYTAHKGRAYSLCIRMTRGNTGLAEDLTQEVFLQAYRKIQSFRGESAFSTWLHRITINAVLMRPRKPVVQEISFEELQPEQEDAAPKEEFGRYDLRLECAIDRVSLERAIDALAHGYHMIFVLHDIYGFDHHRAKKCDGTSSNSVLC